VPADLLARCFAAAARDSWAYYPWAPIEGIEGWLEAHPEADRDFLVRSALDQCVVEDAYERNNKVFAEAYQADPLGRYDPNGSPADWEGPAWNRCWRTRCGAIFVGERFRGTLREYLGRRVAS
jgi:hypothetical protein